MILCSFFYHHVLSRKDTFFLITINKILNLLSDRIDYDTTFTALSIRIIMNMVFPLHVT